MFSSSVTTAFRVVSNLSCRRAFQMLYRKKEGSIRVAEKHHVIAFASTRPVPLKNDLNPKVAHNTFHFCPEPKVLGRSEI